ncbi:MAG: type II toxin-antitoxin system death-on-curing family toxin [Nitrososphaerales archaeon]
MEQSISTVALPGILYEATIDFALEKSRATPDLAEQAAILLQIIAAEHPFVDGNKRTAFASAELLLSLNGYYIEVDDEEAIEFILKVARKELGMGKVTAWIESRLKSLI